MYTATYTPGNCGIKRLRLTATTDAQAVAELREAIAEGYRNAACGRVVLTNGTTYHCENRHGDARGQYDQTMIGDE